MEPPWVRLEAWAAKHAKQSLRLRAGAPKKLLADLQKASNRSVPNDLVEFWSEHDGQEEDDVFRWLPGCSPLKPVRAVLARWKEERGDDMPKRVPIAGTQWWDGDNTYVDGGKIVSYTSEIDVSVLGRSFTDALEAYLKLLDSGDYDPNRNRFRGHKGNAAWLFAEWRKKKRV